MAQAPILEGKTALDELGRAIGDLGLHGVTITSQVGGFSLDSPNLYDFYETVCALDVPVFVHPALVPTGYEHLKDYDLPRVLGREVDLTVATTRLIAGGIFDRGPNLKIVMAHFGNPWCMDAAEVMYKNDNVWADVSAILVGAAAHFAKITATGYLQRTVDRVRHAIEFTERPDRFLYGTDWPLAPMNVYADFVRLLFDEEHHQAVFEDNARSLFKLAGELSE